jgi:hypothetical protein
MKNALEEENCPVDRLGTDYKTIANTNHMLSLKWSGQGVGVDGLWSPKGVDRC